MVGQKVLIFYNNADWTVVLDYINRYDAVIAIVSTQGLLKMFKIGNMVMFYMKQWSFWMDSLLSELIRLFSNTTKTVHLNFDK